MASETKHTPGPWTYFYKSKYDEWHVSLPMAGSGMKLALCPDGIQSENREADARLIAATPDLIRELKRLRLAYVDLMEVGRDRIIALGGSCDPVDVMEAGNPWLRAASEAIAKATS